MNKYASNSKISFSPFLFLILIDFNKRFTVGYCTCKNLKCKNGHKCNNCHICEKQKH